MSESSSSVTYKRISLLFFSLSLVLGALSINFADLRIGTYGLIHSLPPTYFLALLFLGLSFLITVKFNSSNTLFLFLHLIALVIFLYFVAALIEATPRFPYVYHVYGHTDYILRNGHVDTALFTYQYWPGQQYLGATIVGVTHLNPTVFLIGYPITLQLISLPLLYAIMRRVSDNPKIVWGGLWFYYVTGWVNQGYYTSAANGYLLFLFIIFMVLFGIVRNREKKSTGRAPILIILAVLFAALVMGHLLSSIVTLSCLAILYVLFRVKGLFGIKRPRSLSLLAPGLLAIMLIVWLYNPLGGYLSGTAVEVPSDNSGELTETIIANQGTASEMFHFESNLRSTYESAVGAAFGLGEQHTKVMYLKVAFTGIILGLSFLGFLYEVTRRQIRFSSTVVLSLLLGISIVPLVVGSYSGEIASRILGYSLPFLAFFAAKNLSTKALSIPLIAFLVIAPVLFVASAYGNEKFDYVSPAEIKGVEFFYEHAPADAKVQSLTQRIWDFKYIERAHWEPLDLESVGASENNTNDSESAASYILLSERDIDGRIFLYGDVDTEKLEAIAESPYHAKVYSSDRFDLFLKGDLN